MSTHFLLVRQTWVVSFTRIYLMALLLLTFNFCLILLRWLMTERTCSISRKQFWSGLKCSAAIFVHYLPNHLIDIFHSAICDTVFYTKTVLSVLQAVILSNGFDHFSLVIVFISKQETKRKTKVTISWAALLPSFLGFTNSQFSL